MKKRKNLLILLIISMSFLLIFALTTQSQQKPVAGQATQKIIQPPPVTKAPSIDPNMLRRLQAVVTRSTMINTLMGNQARMTLENLAKNANIKVNELSIKTIDGNPVSPTPQGQQIDQLNWNAGIKISLIKNRPTFFHPQSNATYSIGRIWIYGVDLCSEFMSYYINNDIFFFKNAILELFLPLNPATYMVAVQVNSVTAPEITLSDRNGTKKIQNVTPLTSLNGFVGLTQISPSVYREGLGLCGIDVKFGLFPPESIFFGGFTITRL